MSWSWANIDWSATGAILQAIAASVGLYVAWTISRAELEAQRMVAGEERAAFGALMLGLCEAAYSEIVGAVDVLSDRNSVMTVAHGYAPAPDADQIVEALTALDFNRMPTAAAALAVADLRRQAERIKGMVRAAEFSVKQHDDVNPELLESMSDWQRDAGDSLAILKRELER